VRLKKFICVHVAIPFVIPLLLLGVLVSFELFAVKALYIIL